MSHDTAADMAAIAMRKNFFIRLESEIDVQHIVRTLHVEVFGVETVITVLSGALDQTGLLVASGLDVAVVEEVVCRHVCSRRFYVLHWSGAGYW